VPAIPVRVKSAPINRAMIVGAALIIAAASTCPSKPADWQWYSVPGVLALGAISFIARGARNARQEHRLRKALAIASQVSAGHGSAREATIAERTRLGMDQPAGDLLGLDEKNRPVWRPANTPVGLFEMPPGTGKTVCFVAPSIYHRAMNGYSLVITDPKFELAPMLVPSLRRLGFEVWVFNPTRKFLNQVGEDILGFYQELIDAVHGSEDERLGAVKLALDYAFIHYPQVRNEQHLYFVQGSRRVLVVVILSEALLYPSRATPTAAYTLITDPARLMARLRELAEVEGPDGDDPIMQFLRGEARNLISRAEENPENFASFCEGASQQLITFNPAGRLAHYGAGAIKSLSAIRGRQIIVFLATPLSHMTELAPAISLMNHNVISAAKSKPDGHPLHIVAEEALAYKFHELTTNLETLRGLKVTADIYVQSYSGLEKAYGREAAQAIESYADVRVYAGINSGVRAKFLSDMLSDVTLRKEDASYRTEMTDMSVSSGEYSRPMRKVNEILAMDRRKAWVFVRGLPPMNLQMVTYAEVTPWRDWAGTNPLTGTRLGGSVRVTISYQGGAHVL
jgi:type IV secretion system protein VirD4